MPRQQHLMTGKETRPDEIVAAAQRSGSRSIAYTYTEPTVFFEYTYDTARLAHGAGLANVYVTNGYMTGEMLETLRPYVDAANVDLKAFRDETYRKYVGARLQPVLDSLKLMKRLGIWLKVTTLVVPGINDDPEELRDAAQFMAGELGVDTPWHISRFFPAYEMVDLPPTPVAVLQQARRTGLEAGLHYVYVGNVAREENTSCHSCGRLLIRRSRYLILENNIEPDQRCPDCGARVAGAGSALY
jgi:pyruvate formate lyase activating enzyme